VHFGDAIEGWRRTAEYFGLRKPEAFELAYNTSKAIFSDDLTRRAYARLFWTTIFYRRVINEAPIGDIDAAHSPNRSTTWAQKIPKVKVESAKLG
jgi:hypothetical protein